MRSALEGCACSVGGCTTAADGGECANCWADRDVVHSDGLLIANRYGLLLQRVNVRNTINEWNQEVQAR